MGEKEAAPPGKALPRRRSSVVLEVRRHAERGDRTSEASELSERGRAMARDVGARSAPFALVLASPALRARQTAELIAGRLDAIEPALLPDMGGILSAEEFMALGSLAEVGAILGREPARAFAERQLRAWAEIAGRVAEDERVLGVSHGGLIDLVALLAAERLGVRLEGPTFGYCEGIAVTFRAGAPTALEPLRIGP